MDSCSTMTKKIESAASTPETITRSSTRSPSPSKSANSKARRKSNSLPVETVDYLKAWMMSPEHISHPYPTEQEKVKIMEDTGIELKQLTNWFVNNRKRFWKPRVEAKLVEQAQTYCAPSKRTNAKKIDLVPYTAAQHGMSLTSALSVDPSAFLSPSFRGTSSSNSSVSSPSRLVSDNSSLASEEDSDSVGSTTCDEEIEDVSSAAGQQTIEDLSSLLTQTEYVNVHILRPLEGSVPSLDDVTILTNVPEDRVLHTFEDYRLTYQVPSDAVSNSQKIQYHRDAEMARLKKHCLDRFLAQPLASTGSKRAMSHLVEDDVATPRPKYRRVSLELWKEACQSARSNYYDTSLPSLEEAATLFGFAQS